MSRAVERVRCKGRRQTASRRIRPGFALGTLTVGLRPDRATGLAGDAAMRVFASTDTGEDIAVEPSAGSTRNADGDLVAPIAAGVPLACSAGTECAPSGSYGIAGGFDLVFGGRRTAVGNLALSAAGPPDALQWTLTGTLDGAPVTVATAAAGDPSLQFTAEFSQRAGATLGVGSVAGQISVGTRFTRTAPA